MSMEFNYSAKAFIRWSPLVLLTQIHRERSSDSVKRRCHCLRNPGHPSWISSRPFFLSWSLSFSSSLPSFGPCLCSSFSLLMIWVLQGRHLAMIYGVHLTISLENCKYFRNIPCHGRAVAVYKNGEGKKGYDGGRNGTALSVI